MDGPSGAAYRDLAGEFGEYHHSRNFTKKMAVGNRRRRESRKSLGNFEATFLSCPKNPRRACGGTLFCAASAAAR
jgi:hypothetical protein